MWRMCRLLYRVAGIILGSGGPWSEICLRPELAIEAVATLNLPGQVLLNESGVAGSWGGLDKLAERRWMQCKAKSFGTDLAHAARAL